MIEDWIEAAKLLVENPRAQVPCPECGLAFLEVEDEPLADEHTDRWLKCPSCGACNIIYLKNKRL